MTPRRIRVAVLAAVLAWAAAVRAETGGRFLSPLAGETLSPGAVVEVRWTPPCPSGRAEVDEAEIVLSLDDGLTFPIRVSHELSPCASRFLWRVPSFATGGARLALRTGVEGFGASERIAFLTGSFRIATDLDGRVQQLHRRASEWWTPPEPTVLTAEDLFGGAMSSAQGRILSAAALPDLADSPTPSGVSPQQPRAGLRAAASSETATSIAALHRRVRASDPLRL